MTGPRIGIAGGLIAFLGVVAMGASAVLNGVSEISTDGSAANVTPVAASQSSGGSPPDPSSLAMAQSHIEAREYHATINDRGLQAPNRRHNLRTYFESEGIRVLDREGESQRSLAEMRLLAFGRGSNLADVGPGVVEVDGARVEIRRQSILEWYVNDSSGLEQGFTLDERPIGGGAVVLKLGLTGADILDRGDTLRLKTHEGRQLDYGKLFAFDAKQTALPVEFVVSEVGEFEIHVDDSNAQYPILIDPLLTAASDTFIESNQAAANLGYSVADAGDVNGDGFGDVVIGAFAFDAGEVGEGAAFIFYGGGNGIFGANPSAATQIESNQAGARLGLSVDGAGDVNGDGYADVIVSADLYDGTGVDAGAALVFHGQSVGILDGDPATADAYLESLQSGANFSRSVSSAGDVNGDGYADVIVGAIKFDAGDVDEGAAFVFHGGPSGIGYRNSALADTFIEANQASSDLGKTVSGAGDINGDGYDDIVLGADLYDAGQTNEGAIFVFHGSASGIASGSPATADTQLEGGQADALFGNDVSTAGDVNGDGFSDIVVGAWLYNAGSSDEGAAFVFHGSANGIASGTAPNVAAAQIESDQADAHLGIRVSGAGDVNGDGYSDLIVGADLFDAPLVDEGAAFVFYGSQSGIGSRTPLSADAAIESDQAGAKMGLDVSGAGDVNGDGFADVIVGASEYSNGQGSEGAAFVFHGGAQGTGDRNPSAADGQLESNQDFAQLGLSVASAGDVNGDGYSDVVVGAIGYDAGEANEGAAFIFHGSASGITGSDPLSAATLIESNQTGAQLGISVASAGDVNGDGFADVVIGSRLYDAGELDEGAAFVFHGSSVGVVGTNPSNADAQIESNLASGELGISVSSAGDVNGDGYSDVIVGAFRYTSPEVEEGAAFLFHGSAAGVLGSGPSDADAQIESDLTGANLGFSVSSAGDVNGDGFSDVVVGANFFAAGELGEGAALILHGGLAGIGDRTPSTADALIESNQPSAQLGISVSSAGDVNGDGFSDIVVGAGYYDFGELGEGAAFVFHGGTSGIGDGNPLTADAQVESNQAGAQLGTSVSGAGDVNGDGFSDVVVGAPNYSSGENSEGVALLFHGSSSGIGNGSPANADAQLESNQSGSFFGRAVAGAGDVNGDGFSDVTVGAPVYDSGEAIEGAAFVFHGNSDGRPVLAQQRRDDGTATPIQPWGRSNDSDSFEVSINATHPDGRGRVKLEVEVCPAAVPFGDGKCSHHIGNDWTDVTASANGVTLSESVTPSVSAATMTSILTNASFESPVALSGPGIDVEFRNGPESATHFGGNLAWEAEAVSPTSIRRVGLYFDIPNDVLADFALDSSATAELTLSILETSMDATKGRILGPDWLSGFGGYFATWDSTQGFFFVPSGNLNVGSLGLNSTDVTSDVQAWASGAEVNRGWAISNSDGDAFTVDSFESSSGPILRLTINGGVHTVGSPTGWSDSGAGRAWLVNPTTLDLLNYPNAFPCPGSGCMPDGGQWLSMSGGAFITQRISQQLEADAVFNFGFEQFHPTDTGGDGGGITIEIWDGNPLAGGILLDFASFASTALGERLRRAGTLSTGPNATAGGDLYLVLRSNPQSSTGGSGTASVAIDAVAFDSGVPYRWRARVLHAPLSVGSSGTAEPPNPAHGPWRRPTAQRDEGDVRLVPEPAGWLGLLLGCGALRVLQSRRLCRL